MLWYHDHVMGVTRFKVYAGLAGLWDRARRPRTRARTTGGPPYELPLVLTDRNFDTDPGGAMTGQLLHKTDPDVPECFGPFTRVNGTIWPYIEVERPRTGSGCSTLERPHFFVSCSVARASPTIGGSSRSAARAGCSSRRRESRRKELVSRRRNAPTFWSTSPTLRGDGAHHAEHGQSAVRRRVRRPDDRGRQRSRGLLPYPDVLRLRVIGGRRSTYSVPSILATDFQRTREEDPGRLCRARDRASSSDPPRSMGRHDADLARAGRGSVRRRAGHYGRRGAGARSAHHDGGPSLRDSRTLQRSSRCCTNPRSGGLSI